MPTTIYHNARCSKSRETLAILREAGIEPIIIDYLNVPIHKDTLRKTIATMQLSVRDVLRSGEDAYARMALQDAGKSDDELLDAIIANPILLNRPIVVTDMGARLCRPPELVFEILPNA